MVVVVLIEEIHLEGKYAVEDGTRHGWYGLHHHQIAEETRKQDPAHKGDNVLQLTIVPLDKVTIYLNSDDIEHEVSIVAVEERTYQNPPHLVIELYSGVVLILEFEEGTVPGEFVLHWSRVDVDDFSHEAQHQDEAHDERYTLHSEMREEDGVKGRGSQS